MVGPSGLLSGRNRTWEPDSDTTIVEMADSLVGRGTSRTSRRGRRESRPHAVGRVTSKEVTINPEVASLRIPECSKVASPWIEGLRPENPCSEFELPC
jgi:hypothetical protein